LKAPPGGDPGWPTGAMMVPAVAGGAPFGLPEAPGRTLPLAGNCATEPSEATIQ
jgi:hypothetical protein